MARSILNAPILSSKAVIGRLARFPFALLPRDMAIPILGGNLRGKRWIAGAAINRCWFGLYEREKQQCISREVRPGTVFWDLGANVGFYSLLASGLVGSGRVFAFEPVPRNLFYLYRHLALNQAENVEVLAMAVSDVNGVSSFETEETGAMGHLNDKGNITVQTATLDSLVREDKVLPPDYVKMDIEGAEWRALQGASETFQRFHPILFLATHGRQVHIDCVELLGSWGYSCEWLDGCSSMERGELVARLHP